MEEFNFSIQKEENLIILTNSEKSNIADFVCVIDESKLNHQFKTIKDFAAFLDFFEKNPSEFIVKYSQERNLKSIHIKEKSPKWREGVETLLEFKLKEEYDELTFIDKKLSLIISHFDEKNEFLDFKLINEKTTQNKENVEKMIQHFNKIQVELEKDLKSKEENEKKLQQKLIDLEKMMAINSSLVDSLKSCLSTVGTVPKNQIIKYYNIYDSDSNDVSYSGVVHEQYGGYLYPISDLQNNTLTSGIGLASTQSSKIIIVKSGIFSEMILGGNQGVPGGWNTNYWNNCSMVFFNNKDIVTSIQLTQANSNGSKWNGFPLGFQMTKVEISGYCSFSKISFKK
jgi:hypothetical protein